MNASTNIKSDDGVTVGWCGRCGATGMWAKCWVLDISEDRYKPHPGAPHGTCNRCQGKGHITLADTKRNAAYDLFAFRRECSGMMA